METPIYITIKKIKDTYFFINEDLYTAGDSKLLKIELSPLLTFSFEGNIVEIKMRVFYHYADAPMDQILMDIHVQNVFEIPELERFKKDEMDIKLSPELITTLVSLSISHTRALLAKNISGTIYQNNIMSVVDPSAVARYFFPRMFEESVVNKQIAPSPKTKKTTGRSYKKVVKRPSKNSY